MHIFYKHALGAHLDRVTIIVVTELFGYLLIIILALSGLSFGT